jgi:hypothetical protein
MAVIIGSSTTVVGFEGVVSVNWNLSPNVQRLWQLGSFTPYDTILNVTQTLSVVVYGSPAVPIIPIVHAGGCVDSAVKFDCTVNPAACEQGIEGPSGTFYLSGYSYSKGSPQGHGQCTYNGQQWVSDPIPNLILCGGAEGTKSTTNDITGVVFSSIDATGFQGSVSAGFPGVGNASETAYGIVSSVGNDPAGISHGKTATANVTVKHQPLWFE